MIEEGIKRDFSNRETEMLIKILNTRNNDLLCLSSLARLIDTAPSNPYFVNVIRELIKYEILTISTIGRMKFIKIQHKKLRDFIDEQFIVEQWYEYFSTYHKCWW